MAVITHKDGTAAAVLGSNSNKSLQRELHQYEEDNAEQMAQLVSDFTADLQNLQEQLDASITSWFYSSDPSTSTPPASDWTTDQEKADHVGDLYYNKTSGEGWRWQYVSDHYDWVEVTDAKVLEALYAASKAQDTIDSKRRVFYNTPVTPYDRGDLWVQGSQGDILRADVARTAAESYVQADWILASKYTDDTAADAAQSTADDALELAGTASQLAGTKTRVYYQSCQPTGGTYVAGDVWFDSDDDNKMYRWTGSAWSAVLLGNDALANLSAGKITSGTIDAGEITVSNINGGNITSGTISAARIAAIDTIKYNSNNYSQIESDGLHVHQGGYEVAKFGSNVTLGNTSNYYFQITQSSSQTSLACKTGSTKKGEFVVDSTSAHMRGSGTAGISVTNLGVGIGGNTEVYDDLTVFGMLYADNFQSEEDVVANNIHQTITAGINGAVTLSTSWQKVTLIRLSYTGSSLSVSSGGIKCAKAGNIMYTAQAHFAATNDTNYCDMGIGSSTSNIYAETRERASGGGAGEGYTMATIAPRTMYVGAGTTLYLYVKNGSSANGSVPNNDSRTYMTIWYV